MPAGITINPDLVTNAPGTFFVSSEGYIQGFAEDDPAIRNELVSGILAATQTTPVWGGCGITESLVTAGQESGPIGSVLALATAAANLTGFTVYNQSHAMMSSPQSPAPLATPGYTDASSVLHPGGSINFYRLGSGARIAVKISQAAAAALAGQPINTAVYWDYTNQQLLSAPGGTAIAVKLIAIDSAANSRTVSYSSTTGFATWNESDYVAVIQI